MLRGISTFIPYKSTVLDSHRTLIVIRRRNGMTDKIPHVPKQECTQLTGHINNLNLGIGVVYVVT